MRQIRQSTWTEDGNLLLTGPLSPMSSRQARGTTALGGARWMLLVVVAWACLGGCGTKNLGIGSAQMMPERAIEEWLVDAPFDRVWQIASEEAEMNSDRILVSSKQEGLISWCEEVENWRDLAQGSVTARSLVGVRNPDIIQGMAMTPGRGTAVTTLWIEDLGSKTRLHVERTYYGRESYSGVGHACGDYEKDLYLHIVEALE